MDTTLPITTLDVCIVSFSFPDEEILGEMVYSLGEDICVGLLPPDTSSSLLHVLF